MLKILFSSTLLLLYLLHIPVGFADNVIRVQLADVQQQELTEEVPLTGTVSPAKISLLSTEVAGLISEFHVDAGDQVKAGDLLLKLDTELSETDRDSARATASGARAALENSKRRLSEAQTLAQGNNIAASEVRALEAQVSIDNAALQAIEAEARRREAELKRHHIIAPFDGTVSRKLAEVGEWLSPGAEVLELVATDELRIDFQIPQRFYPRINEQTRLSINFEAYPQQSFLALVHRKVPLSSSGSRTFLLRTLLEDEQSQLIIPGMSANAVLRLNVEGDGITVPRDALLRYPDGRVSVWVVNNINSADNTAEVKEQQVETGLAFADQVEIRSGLQPGQQVVTRGNEALREGQKVQIDMAGKE